MHIIFVTGISGSGKSVCLAALEDYGYYCIDNLPPQFLPSVLTYLQDNQHQHVAVAIDARLGNTLNDIPKILKKLRTAGHHIQILFLNANTNALIKRFSETRRRHPLSTQFLSSSHLSLNDAIENERTLLAPLAESAHQIDTTNLVPNQLKVRVKKFADNAEDQMILTFESFGFKQGIPLDADFVFDVRFLPNPYYEKNLRALTGLDEAIVNFLQDAPEVFSVLQDISQYLKKWLPLFQKDNRSYVTVAIGCTGGQHRSVYIAQNLSEKFKLDYQVLVWHRDLLK